MRINDKENKIFFHNILLSRIQQRWEYVIEKKTVSNWQREIQLEVIDNIARNTIDIVLKGDIAGQDISHFEFFFPDRWIDHITFALKKLPWMPRWIKNRLNPRCKKVVITGQALYPNVQLPKGQEFDERILATSYKIPEGVPGKAYRINRNKQRMMEQKKMEDIYASISFEKAESAFDLYDFINFGRQLLDWHKKTTFNETL